MAQIVLIANGTYREGLNNLNDVVSIHEDNVVLGDSYSSFKIISLPKIKAREIRASLEKNLPETKLVKPEETTEKTTNEFTAWNDNGIWKKIETPVKYELNLDIKESEITLAKEVLPLVEEKAISNLRVSDNQKIITLK